MELICADAAPMLRRRERRVAETVWIHATTPPIHTGRVRIVSAGVSRLAGPATVLWRAVSIDGGPRRTVSSTVRIHGHGLELGGGAARVEGGGGRVGRPRERGQRVGSVGVSGAGGTSGFAGAGLPRKGSRSNSTSFSLRVP